MTSMEFWEKLASHWIVVYRPEEKMQTDKRVAEYFSDAYKVQGGVPNLLDAINNFMEEDDGDYI